MNENGTVPVHTQHRRDTRPRFHGGQGASRLAEKVRTQVRARIERELPRLIRTRVLSRLD